MNRKVLSLGWKEVASHLEDFTVSFFNLCVCVGGGGGGGRDLCVYVFLLCYSVCSNLALL